MNIKYFLMIGCLLAVSGLWSQTKNMPIPPDTLTNSNVNNTVSLCNNGPLTAVFNKEHTNCIGGQTKLYYSLSSYTPFQFGVGVILQYRTMNYAGTADISSSYKIYGPFNSTDDYAFMIGANSAPILESGTSNTGWRIFNSSILANKLYIVEVTAANCDGRISWDYNNAIVCSYSPGCESCMPKFQPADKLFVVSAWVKEETASGNGAINYTNTQLKVTSGSTVVTFTPSGQIIDGWQRIEGTILTNAVGNMKMECIVTSGTSYFDDIRVFPTEGNMITYVYDPATLRLVAELDERNYAKIYEYDEEGKLIRVKKETERGIMTIQENRENSSTTVPGY